LLLQRLSRLIEPPAFGFEHSARQGAVEERISGIDHDLAALCGDPVERRLEAFGRAADRVLSLDVADQLAQDGVKPRFVDRAQPERG
jgi:hypothetical protein